MKDPSSTNSELIEELSALKKRIKELERPESDRKKAEDALRESEEKFKAIFDSAGDGIILADSVTKRLLRGNTPYVPCWVTQRKRSKVLRSMMSHPPGAIPHVLDEFEKQAKREKALAEGLPVFRKDGSVFYADVNSTVITIGATHYLVGFFRDITERKQEEEKIRSSLLEKETFLKEINHRVKNNLQVISSLLDLQSSYLRRMRRPGGAP